MRQVIRALFVLVGFVLLGIALFHAVRLGFEWDERAPGPNLRDIGVVLVGLAGLVGLWWTDRALARAAENRRLQRLARGFDGQRLVARLRLDYFVLFVVLIGAMAAVPLWVLPDLLRHFEARPAIAALCGGLVALMLGGVFLPYLRRRGPALILDADGVDHVLYGRIPWAQVDGLFLRELTPPSGPTQFRLLLGVADPRAWAAREPALSRWMRAGGPDGPRSGVLSIPLNLLDVEPEIVHLAATTLRDRVAPPRMKHWAPGMDPGFVAAARDHDARMARLEDLLRQLEQANARTDASAAAQVARLELEVDAAMKDLEAAHHAMMDLDPLAPKR
jgi:hypothetical protein